ncbi:serine/threonine-protein kinase haspin homolog [Eurosta solidaginis]|uniref:serine/threonine-protein kinase haspin homolog n=1 Tax=Eurosta solidaginis TaxID=178769 RepID=UPI003530DD2B
MEDNSEQDFDLNKTLEDGAWMDSFDKILGPRPTLRETNTLKRKVNASYNRDSSVENSINSKASESSLLQLQHSLNEINEDQQKQEKERKSSTISTPQLHSNLKLDPFKCSLSPIGAWRLLYFNKQNDKNKNAQLCASNEDKWRLKCTPIKPIIEIVDYDESLTQTVHGNNDSGSILFRNVNGTKAAPHETFITEIANKSAPRITNSRHVCFKSTADKTTKIYTRKTLSKDISTINTIRDAQREVLQRRIPSLTLQPGKWRKSFNAWRRQQDKRPSSFHKRQSENRNNSIEFLGYVGTIAGHRKSIFIKPEPIAENFVSTQTPEDCVLKRCNQKHPLHFDKVYSKDEMMYCVKIGEGAYGEVFLKAKSKRKAFDASSTVMKVIPIEGTVEVNGEKQKTYEQILSEVVISKELANLRSCVNSKNITCGFVNVKQIVCVKGEYPQHLKNLWEDFDKEKCSENDHPDIFDETQIYIILELEFCGQDMESFQFQNAEQAYYALLQIVLTLAVAECAYQFEHRDLHWGNVLLLSTNAKELPFTIDNHTYVVPTKGVKATLIDYTLSRMTVDNCCHYNDISCDEDLFTATGDYQFDIYRMMRDVLGNNWETFEPRTNIFWISYVISKMIEGVQYKNRRTKAHTIYNTKLQHLSEIVLNYNSAVEFTKYLMTLV